MASDLFQSLDREWIDLGRRAGSSRALRAWAERKPILGEFSDLHEVVAFANRRRFPAQSDRVLAALAELATDDTLAARTLLQAVLPGLKALRRSQRFRGEEDELTSMITSNAWERIRAYPIERRPEHVAANIVLDVRQALVRDGGALTCEARLEADALALDGPGTDPRSAAENVMVAVREAVRRGALDRASARLIVLSRVVGLSPSELAAAAGCSAQVLRRRRLRAEQRLRPFVIPAERQIG